MREDIRYFHNTKPNEPFLLEMTGISYCDGSYSIERKKEDEYAKDLFVFEYIVKGTGTVIVEGQEYTASAGDIYIITGDTNHQYFSSAKNPWEKIFFNTKGAVVSSLLTAYGIQDTVLIKDCDLHSEFLRIYEICCEDKGQQEIVEKCALLIHEIISKIHEHTKPLSSHSQEGLVLKRFLDENIRRNITIEELGDQIYRSRDYTIKLFKKEFKETPYNYLLKQKIEVAKNQLKNTTQSIKQIAVNVGYNDQHHFSNLFKKHTGVYPKEYRCSSRSR